MDQVDTLSRSEIREYDGDHMYVLNISDNRGSRPKQELLLTFSINGNDIIINIPNTWIPIDLTSKVNIKQIKENRDFWLFVSRRELAVISKEVAEEFLDEDDAQEEYNRIFGIDDSDERGSVHLNKRGSTNRFKKEKPAVGSLKVISIMKKDIPETTKLAALKNIKEQLTENDFKYILNEAKTGEADKIKAWATNPR